MKKLLSVWLAVALTMALTPLIVYNITVESSADGETNAEPLKHDVDFEFNSEEDDSVISVFVADSGKVETMFLRDYIIGALAGEMPAAYEPAALSAQAIASLTLALRLNSADKKDESISGAAISTDSKKHQAYMSIETMKERWGDDFEKYYGKLCSAVDEIFDYVITYNGEPILAAFHAISAGRTESAENVWLSGEDYLISVESEGDSFSPKYSSSLTVSAEEFAEKLKTALGIEFTQTADEWLGDSEYTQASTLKNIKICGQPVTGAQLREIFGLRSAAISLKLADGSFIFDVKGYGHGVGLSQYGADYYARQGMTWREIIAHYYPGTEIRER